MLNIISPDVCIVRACMFILAMKKDVEHRNVKFLVKVKNRDVIKIVRSTYNLNQKGQKFPFSSDSVSDSVTYDLVKTG